MNRRGRDIRSLLLAGWLFADLLAMLFVISLASQTKGAAAAGKVSPSPSPSPSTGDSAHSSPSPGTKPSTGPDPAAAAPKIGLDPHWIEVDLTDISYAELSSEGPEGKMAQRIVSEMTDALKGKPGRDRPVGFVATFTQTHKDPALGDDVSDLANKVLFKHHQQFAHATGLNLWQEGPAGTVQVKVFFLNQ